MPSSVLLEKGPNGEFKHFAFAASDILVVYSTYNPTCTGFYTADPQAVFQQHDCIFHSSSHAWNRRSYPVVCATR
jgi:hypothetical protein